MWKNSKGLIFGKRSTVENLVKILKKKWKCQPNRRYTGTLSVPFLSVAPGTVAARRAGTTWIRGISRITRTFADTAWPAWRNSLLLAIIATDRLVASPKTRVPTPNIGEWFFNRQIPRASNGILGSSSVLTIDDSFDRSKSRERFWKNFQKSIKMQNLYYV